MDEDDPGRRRRKGKEREVDDGEGVEDDRPAWMPEAFNESFSSDEEGKQILARGRAEKKIEKEKRRKKLRPFPIPRKELQPSPSPARAQVNVCHMFVSVHD